MRSAPRAVWFCFLLIILPLISASGSTIHVPAEQPTIQSAINVAINGDMILVAPGTYLENLNFMGKAITVQSVKGPAVTIIDGGGLGAVVTFSTGETNATVLHGFTIQNGNLSEGAGIAVESSSPTISGNIITHNGGCNGAGIGIGFGSPIVSKNTISFNKQAGCSGGIGGGGISVRGASSAQILGNTIVNNNTGSDGGGISLFAAGTPLIQANVIRNNKSFGNGGGIVMFNQSDANIIDNVIGNNTAFDGGGIYWLVPSGDRGPYLINNTISANNATSTDGSEIYADGFDINAIVSNTIIIGRKGQTAFFCGNFNDTNPPMIQFNDVFNPTGNAYGGICTDQTGQNGNISANPQFVSGGNVRLQYGSPAIDAGNNRAPDLPTTDISGKPRLVNGNGGPTAIVDMGAYEFVPVALNPTSLAFGVHPVGSTTTKTTILTNNQNKPLKISSTTHPAGYSVSGCPSPVAALSSCTLTISFQPKTSGVFKGNLTIKDDAGNTPQTVSLSGTGR